MNETDVAWAAGLFDGEGCVLTRWPTKHEVTIEIKMVHKPTIEKFNSIFPGNITKRIKNGGFGKKIQWRWRVSDKRAICVGEALVPYLCEKREQIICMIDFKKEKCLEKKFELANKIRSLKKIEFE